MAVTTPDPRRELLEELFNVVHAASSALLPNYSIIEHRRPLPLQALGGLVWGYGVVAEQLEQRLADLQGAVVDGALPAHQAVEIAHELVLEAISELRFGARLKRRRFHIVATLSPRAELGRLTLVVRRLADELADLADRIG